MGKELQAQPQAVGQGSAVEQETFPFSGRAHLSPQGTQEARLFRLGKGTHPGELPAQPSLPRGQPRLPAPWACPHLYRIKCFVY